MTRENGWQLLGQHCPKALQSCDLLGDKVVAVLSDLPSQPVWPDKDFVLRMNAGCTAALCRRDDTHFCNPQTVHPDMLRDETRTNRSALPALH